ncbi:MAG: hypothetical protein ACREK5_02915 [Gemmatimonadota bacterium]
MTRRLEFLAKVLGGQLARSLDLTALGVLGLVLGGLCAAAALVRGAAIPREGNLLETASFDGAVGVFILTLAVLALGVSWTPRGRRVWGGFLIALTLYSYGIETLQAFRGLDPRFSRVAGPLDQAAGGLFFLAAVGIMVCFIVLAVKYFRAEPDPVTVAVRYGAAASLVAFGVGIWMSLVTNGRHVPEAGNLLFLHATGFHGLQAVPLVALLLRWAGPPESAARRRVHLAGMAWLGACLAIALQSGSGRGITEPSPATAATVVLLLVFGVTAFLALLAWLSTAPPWSGPEPATARALDHGPPTTSGSTR